MRSRIVFCAILMMFICGFSVSRLLAQIPSKIEHYSTEDGLSHDFIACMFKDSEGYMWFGTWDGINRFDGHNFKVYKSVPGDRSPLKSNRIDQITEDNAGHLWLKSYDGQIYRFDKATEQFTQLSAILGLKEKITYDKILSTTDGQLWVSTVNSGLIWLHSVSEGRKDFSIFKQGGTSGNSLPSNKVSFYLKDRQGNIWVGTSGGLAGFSADKKGGYIPKKPDAPKAIYVSVAEDNRNIYFGTADGRLISFQKQANTFSSPIKLSEGQVNNLLPAANQDVLYATTSTGQLVFIDTKTNAQQQFNYGAALNSIFEDPTGNLWLEPAKYGIIRFDIQTKKFKLYTQQIDTKYDPGYHFKVFEDSNGIVWAIMRAGGFGYYDPLADKIAYFYNQPGNKDHRFSNIVTVAFYDPTGVMWLHSDERGLEKIIFQSGDFKQHLLDANGMFKSDNEVRGLLQDRQGRTWVGVKNGGLYVFKDGAAQRNVFINAPQNGFGSIYTMLQDSRGRIWLGTKPNGLYRADPVDAAQTRYKLTHIEHNPADPTSIGNDEIYALLEDSHHRLWVGTFNNGLFMADAGISTDVFHRITPANDGYPTRFNKIRHLALDKAGRLWLATTDGLVVADISNNKKYHFDTYTKQPGDTTSLGSNDIQYICRDSRGRMWLAAAGGGLNQAIADKTSGRIRFRAFTTKNGLANDYLLSCTEDKQHYLWIATKGSLSRFDPSTGLFKNYNSYDGVPNSTFSEGTCQQLQNGQLAFGTTRGYITFNPAGISSHPVKANIVFTNLQVNNQDITGNSGMIKNAIGYTDTIQLIHNQGTISIDYTVLDYRSGNNQLYESRLVGYDPVWHDHKNQRRATYTNLEPGHYVFEVRSINADRYSNSPSKKLAIIIMPPWWLTWWAYIIYAVLAILILSIIRRTVITMLRLRQKIAVEHQLTELKLQFFTNMSHELRTPLTLITNPAEEILKSENLTEHGKAYFAMIRRNAGRMTRFVNQLLDLRKVQGKKAELNLTLVEIVAFVEEIGGYFEEALREKKLTFSIISSSKSIYSWIDADKFETVIYNLISNSYKFTPSGKKITLTITFQQNEGLLKVQVDDEGRGVPDNELSQIFELYHEGAHFGNDELKGSGIGLALTKELVNIHGGSIIAENRTGGGLSVSVVIPVGSQPATVNTPATGNLKVIASEGLSENSMPIHQTEGKPLLLLVEDNPDLRAFLTRQLSSIYQVVAAIDGNDGLTQARKLLPEIILSDVMMPGMDGIEMLKQLKNDEATSHIPVVLLTAKSAVESQINGLNHGADYYITKPFENDFLFAAVAGILERRKKYAQQLVSGKTLVALNPGEVLVTSKDELFLKKVIAVIEEKMTDPDFNIDAVAEVLNMSRPSFFNKFKSLTQQAPVEFVRDMRLKRAKQYLDAGAGNITEIAYQSGFSSAKYFSTCFKVKYDLSPSDYLKNLKDKDIPD